MRGMDPHDPRVGQFIAELEFRLADALPDGKVAVHVSPWGLSEGDPGEVGAPAEPWLSIGGEGIRRIDFRQGLERRELRAVLDILACDPPPMSDRRTQLWLAELPHVRIHCASSVRGGPQGREEARRRLAPSAPPAMQAPLASTDVRRLCGDGRLAWLDAAASMRPELAPEVVSDCNDPNPNRGPSQWRWRRFVQLVLAGEGSVREPGADPRCPPVLEGCIDHALATEDAGALKDIFAALEGVAWAEASLFAVRLRRGDRLAKLLLLDPGLCAGVADEEVAELVSHLDRRVRIAALAALPRPAACDAALGVLRAPGFEAKDEQERGMFFAVLKGTDCSEARDFLVALLERKGDKSDDVLVSLQLEAVRLLGTRRGALERSALKRAGRGWTLHREVRRAIRGVLAGWEAA